MIRTAATLLCLIALSACGERSDTAAPAAAGPVEPPVAAAEPVPTASTSADLRRVCRAGLAAIHGQGLDDIAIDGVEGQVVNASWRAPVDGGRRKAQCRIDGDLVTWKQAEATNPEQNRWMNQSGDPVTRFVLDGEAITINTTLPDGTTASETYSVAGGQEAR